MKRLVLIISAGCVLILAAWLYTLSRKPGTVPDDIHEKGMSEVSHVLGVCSESEWARTGRGKKLCIALSKMVKRRMISFTPDISQQALLRGEGRQSILYIRVLAGAKGAYIFPDRETLAEALFHEALHYVQNNRSESIEEEVDAFHAAEEARASYLGVKPVFPLKRDGIPVQQWVKENYTDLGSNPGYRVLE